MGIKLPYKANGSQKSYIMDTLKWMKNDNKYTFMEGPTGMGKTVCNLMTAIKWIKDGGKVVYFTREHIQIDQCYSDLTKILLKNPDIDYVKALHISGLSQACLRPEVLALDNDEEQRISCEEFHDNLCNYSSIVKEHESIRLPRHQILSLMPEYKNLYYNFNLAMGDSIANTMDSMEHMVVTEHNDILDEMFDNMLLSNDKIMTIAKKYTTCPRKLQNLALDHANIIFAPYPYLVIPRIHYPEPDEDGNYDTKYLFIIDEAHNLDINLRDMQSHSIAKSTIFGFIRAVQRDFINDEAFQLDVGTLFTPILDLMEGEAALAGDKMLEWVKKISSDILTRVDGTISMKVRRNIRRRTIYERENTEERDKVPRSFISMQKFLAALSRLKDMKQGIIEVNDKKFNIKFMDADKIFNDITVIPEKVMICSGTLFPNYMRYYLGMTRDNSEVHEYDPPHVNLRGSGHVVSKIGDIQLTTNYKKRSMGMAVAYGDLIRDAFNKKLKAGMLVFFPSYPFRDLLIDLLQDLPIFLPEEVDDYRREIAAGNKAIFMTALRGKGSEGWNFPDDQSRIVIVIGVPFSPLDISVKSQKAYYNSKRRGLGDDWYKQKAALWLVQSFGRAFRHKYDHGQIYFADYRVPSLRRYFPKWVQPAMDWMKRPWEKY